MSDARRDIEGLRVACVYSWGCPELNCLAAKKLDPNPAERVFNFAQDPAREPSDLIHCIMLNLETFWFYRLICLLNEKEGDVFLEEIVRAHWLPNSDSVLELLKQVPSSDIGKLLGSLDLLRGSHRLLSIVSKIRNIAGTRPHHNSIIIQLFKGINPKQLPAVLLKDSEKCLVRTAKVTKVFNHTLEVQAISLTINERGELSYVFSEEQVDRGFVSSVKESDLISIHLGVAREKITAKDAQRLTAINEEAICFAAKGP